MRSVRRNSDSRKPREQIPPRVRTSFYLNPYRRALSRPCTSIFFASRHRSRFCVDSAVRFRRDKSDVAERIRSFRRLRRRERQVRWEAIAAPSDRRHALLLFARALSRNSPSAVNRASRPLIICRAESSLSKRGNLEKYPEAGATSELCNSSHRQRNKVKQTRG